MQKESDRDQPLNEMAVISARSFTVEETERFAGSVGDPSRMASSFAGVSTLSDQQNEIVIRGNSPMGLLWRLDGADIPNPNHFASLGTTGGGLSMINNNTLSNSDFFTGAFPAEYGNALSGVFDLKMRNGNNDSYEFTAQVGFNGLEAGAEGPISKKQGSSFLLNYRYSMLMLVDKVIGTEALSVSAVPFYHDLSLKFNFPGKKYGKFSITGIGGVSGINEIESDKDTSEWSSSWQDSWQSTLQVSSNLRKKINPKNLYDIGLNIQFIFYKFMDKASVGGYELVPLIQVKGDAIFFKSYFQWQHKFSHQLVLNAGIDALFFGYNKKLSADPRLSFKWQMNARQSLSLGTGIFSQLPEKMFYFVKTDLPDGAVALTNKDLGYMRSFHLVLGYDFLIFSTLRLKVEAYYQHLFDIPVRENHPAYSMLNFGEDSFSSLPIIDSLVSRGTGNNTGIELTLEKFLDRGYYFLFTSSLFKSTYKGYDGIERNTAFSNNFVFNLLVGKEFCIRGEIFLISISGPHGPAVCVMFLFIRSR